MVAQLQERAIEQGATLFTGRRVVQIDPKQRMVRMANGETVYSDAILLAVDPQTAAALMPQSETLQRAAGCSVQVRVGAMNIAFSELPYPKRTFALGIDQPLYFSSHSVGAKLAPEGISVVHLLHYSGHSCLKPTDIKTLFYNLLDQVQPNWRQYVIQESFLPGMIANHRLPTAIDHGFEGRPSVQLPEYGDIFLAGDWVGPEGWLVDASFASGKAAAETIDDKIESASLEKDLYERV